jgi:hypothetical protein
MVKRAIPHAHRAEQSAKATPTEQSAEAAPIWARTFVWACAFAIIDPWCIDPWCLSRAFHAESRRSQTKPPTSSNEAAPARPRQHRRGRGADDDSSWPGRVALGAVRRRTVCPFAARAPATHPIRPGSARPGSARPGSARPGSARLESARLESARPEGDGRPACLQTCHRSIRTMKQTGPNRKARCARG